MADHQIKVGMKICRVHLGYGRQDRERVDTIEVVKVGRKYFTDNHGQKYDLKTLYHFGGQYAPTYKCYMTLKAYQDQKEARALYWEVHRKFTASNQDSFSLEDLKKIKSILKI